MLARSAEQPPGENKDGVAAYSRVLAQVDTLETFQYFFDQVGHQTTNASIGNKHFFTK